MILETLFKNLFQIWTRQIWYKYLLGKYKTQRKHIERRFLQVGERRAGP